MAATMPVELTVFTADRRICGSIPLADDRLSDMLNSVPRVVIRGAQVEDLLSGTPPQLVDVTLGVSSIVAVLVGGRRGADSMRRRTDVHRVRVGIVRYVVSGSLHVPAGLAARLESREPGIVLAGRDVLVPLTDATISYDNGGRPVSESFETILINRSETTWIDLDDGSVDGELLEERPKVYHAAMAKDFTGAT